MDTTIGTKPEAKTENQRLREEILARLSELGGQRVKDDALIFEGTKFVLPANMEGRVDDAIEYLEDWKEAQEEDYAYSREFRYRPWDGAAAFDRAMKRLFGTTGLGARTVSFFGSRPPEYRTIDVAHGQTTQVPWGKVAFKPLSATFELGVSMHDDFGLVFALSVNAPKKYRTHIEAFFAVVEDELTTGSIYKGRAITAADTPQFINTSTVDPSRVVYSDDVMTQLNANVWSVLRYADTMRQIGLPLKRQVLLYGPYGTGKSLAGMLTAQEAERHGWTYIQVRPGDDLGNALRTAQIYAPAVVMFEDVDQINTDSTQGVAQLLDILDGVTNKGVEVMALFTTNHEDRLHRGMMRPGRLDAVIELAGLDAGGTKRLVEAVVPAHLRSTSMDWDAVAQAFDGLLPAFAKEAIDRAQRYAIARSGGVPQVIEARDLVDAAAGIRQQVKMMEDAPLATNKDSLGAALTRTVSSALQGHHVDHFGDALRIVPSTNGIPA
ncbi:AAA family ATPase [Micromonospora sp. C51]|uniref:AAA family ATPase n=1 Tax=Micromonospora sp. C51 TaxID=2824879 RepID=UPI001B38FED3|nr:AAA family ATPase [Micromonospora sp. C51]MBQ1047834.1 AAA family ATPase [Micromonospora sp. C51]